METYIGENPYNLTVTVAGEVLQPMECPFCSGHPAFVIPEPGIVPGLTLTNLTPIEMIIESVSFNTDLLGQKNKHRILPGGAFSLSEEELKGVGIVPAPLGSIDIQLSPADPSALEGLVHSMKTALQPYFTSTNLQGLLDSVGENLDAIVRHYLCQIRVTFATAEFWELQQKARQEVEEKLREMGSHFPGAIGRIVMESVLLSPEEEGQEASPDPDRGGWNPFKKKDRFHS
jgi:hypothetical protein